MDAVLVVVLEILLEILLEVGGEVLLSLGFESLAAPFRKAQTSSRVATFAGILFLGSLAAVLFHLAFPERLLQPSRIPGLSLLVSPLLCGSCMHGYGRWRQSRNRATTRIATFWGGALLAFTFALVRLLALHLR